jgi:hypothetical protein
MSLPVIPKYLLRGRVSSGGGRTGACLSAGIVAGGLNEGLCPDQKEDGFNKDAEGMITSQDRARGLDLTWSRVEKVDSSAETLYPRSVHLYIVCVGVILFRGKHSTTSSRQYTKYPSILFISGGIERANKLKE